MTTDTARSCRFRLALPLPTTYIPRAKGIHKQQKPIKAASGQCRHRLEGKDRHK